MTPVARARIRVCVALAVLVPLGFSFKYFGTRWMANNVAGALYEVFWCLLAFVVFTSSRAAAWIAIAVFLATCGIEFLQLVSHPSLDAARQTFLGRTVLGHHFSWSDFPYYALGSGLGYALMRALGPRGVYSAPARGG